MTGATDAPPDEQSAQGFVLGPAASVEDGQARGFPGPDGRKIIVVRRNGRLFGWIDSCPHFEGGTPMAWKTDAYLDGTGQYLACHSHGALFDIETGACVLGACLGKSLTPARLYVSQDHQIRLESGQTSREIER
ncbi:Rieske (2Fe-2S) protein [Brevundimonas sp. SL130]|uniref:Rieske (2Fe-2S) protein n=1 Tax=Brevundimonas sp. SL130 TaxID=2995143 RepID=UPI00226CAE2A|nr:Rieske 2Fe-2S domain-containing protein [Brevundimonas sp. SL130]WAC59033.1 Rieske 2Fe-2S domain-containing protein [Brevundimonas sp. SL130]